MELKILYDNEAMEGFRREFGFSCLVEERKILFDTGGDVGTMLFNIRKIMINPKDVDKNFLSHEHGDHTGGIQILESFLARYLVAIPPAAPVLIAVI